MHTHESRVRSLSSTQLRRYHRLTLTFPTPVRTLRYTRPTGFTLVEVMIVTAIIAMLVAIAAPSLRAYANKSRVASVTATATAMRTALETYAVETEGSYPPAATLSTWQNWRDLLARFSSPLPATSVAAGIRSIVYTSTAPETYNVQIEVNVPNGIVGKNIVLTPQGLDRY